MRPFSMHEFNKQLTLADKKRDKLAHLEKEKKDRLDPNNVYETANFGTGLTASDADTFKLQGDNTGYRLSNPRRGVSADAFETSNYRYDQNPALERKHKEAFGHIYNVNPDIVTRRQLLQEGHAQKKRFKDFLSRGSDPRSLPQARYRTNDRDHGYGRKGIDVQHVQGESWSDFMSNIENNADYWGKHNSVKRGEDLASGKFSEHFRNKGNTNFIKDSIASTLGVGGTTAAGLVPKLLDMKAAVNESLINKSLKALETPEGEEPSKLRKAAQGILKTAKSYYGKQREQHIKAAEKMDKAAEWVKEKFYSPGLKRQLRLDEEYSQTVRDAVKQQTEDLILAGESPNKALWEAAKTQFQGTMGSFVDNPRILTTMVFENLWTLLPVGIAGRVGAGLAKSRVDTLVKGGAELTAKQQQAMISKAAMRTGISAGALNEGILNGHEVYSEIMGQNPLDIYETSPKMQDLVDNQGYSLEEAQKIIAADAGAKVLGLTAVFSGMVSRGSGAGKIESELLTTLTASKGKPAKGFIGKALKHPKQVGSVMGKEFTEEFFQEGMGHYIQGAVQKSDVDSSVNPMEDTFEMALKGGAAGAGTGAVIATPNAAVKGTAAALRGAAKVKNYAGKTKKEKRGDMPLSYSQKRKELKKQRKKDKKNYDPKTQFEEYIKKGDEQSLGHEYIPEAMAAFDAYESNLAEKNDKGTLTEEETDQYLEYKEKAESLYNSYVAKEKEAINKTLDKYDPENSTDEQHNELVDRIINLQKMDVDISDLDTAKLDGTTKEALDALDDINNAMEAYVNASREAESATSESTAEQSPFEKRKTWKEVQDEVLSEEGNVGEKYSLGDYKREMLDALQNDDYTRFNNLKRKFRKFQDSQKNKAKKLKALRDDPESIKAEDVYPGFEYKGPKATETLMGIVQDEIKALDNFMEGLERFESSIDSLKHTTENEKAEATIKPGNTENKSESNKPEPQAKTTTEKESGPSGAPETKTEAQTAAKPENAPKTAKNAPESNTENASEKPQVKPAAQKLIDKFKGISKEALAKKGRQFAQAPANWIKRLSDPNVSDKVIQAAQEAYDALTSDNKNKQDIKTADKEAAAKFDAAIEKTTPEETVQNTVNINELGQLMLEDVFTDDLNAPGKVSAEVQLDAFREITDFINELEETCS